MRVNAARWALTRRIVDTLGPETGGLAAAMTTGHEAFIPKAEVDDLRAAGLAHIISISGVHMAIVGGFVFAAVRLGVAAWPWLALRVPGKKVAAALGLLASVLAYLVLVRLAAAGRALGDNRSDRLWRHSCRSSGDQPACPGVGGHGRPAVAARGRDPARVPDVFCRHRRAGRVGRGVAPALSREITTPWPIRLAQGAWTWLDRSGCGGELRRPGRPPLPSGCRTSTGSRPGV